MHDPFSALVRAAGTPAPVPTVDPELVTPGPWGFLVIILLALAVILLVWDMMRRIRRGRVRADIQEELDAEQQAADEAQQATRATETDDEDVDGGSDIPPRA